MVKEWFCYDMVCPRGGSPRAFLLCLYRHAQGLYTGFSCPSLYPTIATHYRPSCAVLVPYKGNRLQWHFPAL